MTECLLQNSTITSQLFIEGTIDLYRYIIVSLFTDRGKYLKSQLDEQIYH